MSNIDTIAASIGFTKPSKRMLTREQQIAKYTKLAEGALIAAQLNAERARFKLDTIARIAPGTATYAIGLQEASRYASAGDEARRDAEFYLRRASEASDAPESAMFEDL